MTPTSENIGIVIANRQKTILRRVNILLTERAEHYAATGRTDTAQAAVAWAMHDLGLMDSLDSEVAS